MQVCNARLDEDGFDTLVGGVSAYSTLGRFADPVLNTMMRWSDIDLISTMFHELAHQKLYVKGDSAFNESFATAVADEGLSRWLAHRGKNSAELIDPAVAEMRRASLALVASAHEELSTLYKQDLDIESKRARKRDILQNLSTESGELAAAHNVPNWLAPPLNNARLVSINLYEGGTNIFRAVLDACDGELNCFYVRAEALATMSPEERQSALASGAD